MHMTKDSTVKLNVKTHSEAYTSATELQVASLKNYTSKWQGALLRRIREPWSYTKKLPLLKKNTLVYRYV